MTDTFTGPRTIVMDIDHSGLHASPGSREWIIAG